MRKGEKQMKKFYDNYNSLVIPEETESISELIKEFYQSDIKYTFSGHNRQLDVHFSSAFDRSSDIRNVFKNIDYAKLEYPLMENVYAYAVPNGTEEVLYQFVENDSHMKKLFIPASVNWLVVESWWLDVPKKITDNVWVEVVPENPHFYSKDGSVYKKDTDKVVYLYQKPVEMPQKYGRIKIRNLNGTSDNECECGSWINHWANFNSSALSYIPKQCPCCHKKVMIKDIVGAHVQKEYDNHWYIIPLCKECNSKNSDKTFEVDDIGFAWANKEETCEKYENRYQFLKDFLNLNI